MQSHNDLSVVASFEQIRPLGDPHTACGERWVTLNDLPAAQGMVEPRAAEKIIKKYELKITIKR